MTSRELDEHVGYWSDQAKVNAYRDALDEVVKPGDHVIDLGAGTGLLGMLAVRAGAAKVWAYDDGAVIGVARDLAVANGVADRIEFVRALTTECELPAADVIVCDQIGGLGFDAGVLEYFADAKRRSLRPGGTFVPAGFDLYLAPIESAPAYERVSSWRETSGFNLDTVRHLAANTGHRLDAQDINKLAAGERFASIDSYDDGPISAICEFKIERAGPLHGLAGWFDAAMSASVRVTNDPDCPARMDRWINFYPLESPVDLAVGDRVGVEIDIRPGPQLVTWTVSINGESQGRQSTFDGQFMFDDPFASRLGGLGDGPNRRALAARLLERIVEGASMNELVAEAQQQTDLFVTSQAASKWVYRFVGILSIPGA